MTNLIRDAFEAVVISTPLLPGEFVDWGYLRRFWQAATLAERERCARVCEKQSDANMGHIELDKAADTIRQGGAL